MKKTTLCLLASFGISGAAWAAHTGFQSAVLGDAPFLYYRIGEASGTAVSDSSGNGFTGAYFNAPTLGVPGAYGGDTAAVFNGTSQCVFTPFPSAFTNFSANLAHASFEVVFTNTFTTGVKSLLGAFKSGGNNQITSFNIELNANAAGSAAAGQNLVRLFVRDDSSIGLGATFVNAAAFDGNYHHLVFTYNSAGGTGRVRAYLDGVEQTMTYGSGSGSGGTPVNFTPLNIATAIAARNVRGSATNEFFQGAVDEVALYTNVLSAAAVREHYRSLIDPGLTNLSWSVGNGTWDVNTTANWRNAVTATSDVYVETNGIGNRVRFDDTSSGSSPIAIALDTTVHPRSITNSSTKNYTLSGSGGIAGLTTLTKAGSGTFTLNTSGANTFLGNVTLLGGVLEFGANNLGGSTPPQVIFNNATLRYLGGNADDISLNSVSLEGNATIDVGANSVTFANPIGAGGAGGLTKVGSGTLTLSGTNSYLGNTLVSSGTLALASGANLSSSPAIIVSSGATLDANAGGLSLVGGSGQILAGAGSINGSVISSNGVITPGTNGVVGTLSFGSDLTVAGGSLIIDLATNTAQRDLVVVGGNLSIYGGTLQLNVTGTLTNGIYRLIQYSGSLASGAYSSANLLLTGYSPAGKLLSLSDTENPGEIDLIVSDQSGSSITWRGDLSSSWDLLTQNFTNSVGTPVAFAQGDTTTFNDSSANPTVSLGAVLQPAAIVVSANANNYVFQDGTGTGSGKLTGSGGITKGGSSTLTIATANLNSGPTIINGGTVQVGNGGTLGDLGAGNVANSGALVFNQTDTHQVSGAISGSGTVAQQGSGTVILSGNNTYSGTTTIGSGMLQVGNGGSSGTLGTNVVSNNGTLTFNRNNALSVPNAINGSGAVAVNGGTITLTASNSFTGGAVVNSGKLILGNARALPPGQNLTVEAGGTNDLNGQSLLVSRLNSGAFSGGRIVNNAGSATNVLTVNYDGASTADSSIAIADNDGSGGKIAFVKTGIGEQILRGQSTYSGGTIISNGIVQIRSGSAFGTGKVILRGGNVSIFGVNANLANTFQADTNASFLSGNASSPAFTGDFITSSNLTFDLIAGETWNMSGAESQFAGVTGTVLITGAGGFFRFVGNHNGANAIFDMTGSSASVSSAGNGAVPNPTIHVGALIGDSTATFGATAGATYIMGARNLSTTFTGNFGAVADNLIKVGTGTFTLGGTYGWTGATTVSNGVLALLEPTSLDSSPTLRLGASAAVIDVSGRTDGTLNLGSVAAQTLSGAGTIRGSVNQNAGSTITVGLGTLAITNVATLNGALVMQLNRTNAITSSKLTAQSFVNASELTVTNLGPDLATGDSFQLFNVPMTGFTAVNLPAANAANTIPYVWTNRLHIDGSIQVLSGASAVNPNPGRILSSVSGNVLSLSWPTNSGWTLQIQTNSLSTGLSTNWVDVPGSTAITSTNITLDPARPAIFYRLKL